MRACTIVMMAVLMATVLLAACSSDSTEPQPTLSPTAANTGTPPPTAAPTETALPPVDLTLTRGSFDEEAPFAGVFVLNLAARTWLHIEEEFAEAPVQPLRLIATSPDGQEIALGTSANEVRVLTAQGEEVRSWPRLQAFGGAFSPDGRFLALAQSSAAVVLDVETGEVIQAGVDGGSWVAEWSPDGKELLIGTGGSSGPLVDGQVYVFSIESRETAYISDGLYPTWSPSGDQIALIRDGVLMVTSAVGDQLASWEPEDEDFKLVGSYWLPDGGRLAATAMTLLDQVRLIDTFVIDAATGSLVYRLVGASGLSVQPGTEWLVVTANFCGQGQTLLRFRPDGTASHEIIGRLFGWTWSPDGTEILTTEDGDLVAIDVESEQRIKLMDSPGVVFAPLWKESGHAFFQANSIGEGCLNDPQVTEFVFP